MRHMRGGLLPEELAALRSEPSDIYPINLPKRIVDRIAQPFSLCGCWTICRGWNDRKDDPYFKMKVKGKAFFVHRVTYELLIGEISPGS